MRAFGIVVTAVILFTTNTLGEQIKRTTVPLGDAVDKALAKGSLLGEGARPFHIYVSVSEPENPASPYQGTIEEWWASPSQWRREVTAKDGMRQTIVVADGKKTERDEGDYFPLWLNSFITAIINPVPDAAAWAASGGSIEQITMPNGGKSDACAHAKYKIGTGAAATDAFSAICLDGEGRVKFYGSPRYSMEFHNYHGFGKKHIAYQLAEDPEPGTHLVGDVTRLEEIPKDVSAALFAPLPTDDDRFRSAAVNSTQMEQLVAGNAPIRWPTVRSGNTHGRLAMYVSVDAAGHVREAWPLNSDNAGLEDPAREQVRHWTTTPAVADGKPVQVDGGLGFAFDTQIGDPLPELSDAEVRALAAKVVEPEWKPGSVHSGDTVELSIGVNEQGKLTGLAGIGRVDVSSPLQWAAIDAIRKWTFRPLIRDGKPQYFHGVVKFVVP
jgi:hypothetical protein